MTDAQLYLAIGVPAGVALVGILVNVGYFVVINARLGAVDARLGGVDERIGAMSMSLTGAINELDKRLTRVEIKLGIQP